MSEVELSLVNASKSYGVHTVFENLTLELKRRTTTVIYGASGCGKTTLLKCLALLEPFEKGCLTVNSEVVYRDGKAIAETALRKKVGIVFQDFYLWDNKTILNNITEALIYVKGLSKQEAEDKAKESAEKLHIGSDLLSRYPPELSRGQRQRVAIARTLVMSPEIILLDEASASLDENLTTQLSNIVNLLKDQGRTLLVVTHDRQFASKIGDSLHDFDSLSSR